MSWGLTSCGMEPEQDDSFTFEKAALFPHSAGDWGRGQFQGSDRPLCPMPCSQISHLLSVGTRRGTPSRSFCCGFHTRMRSWASC